jgi:hypothetical protein
MFLWRPGEAVETRITIGGLREMLSRKDMIRKTDIRVVEGPRLEIALTVCDGVLQISITVAKPGT